MLLITDVFVSDENVLLLTWELRKLYRGLLRVLKAFQTLLL